MADNLVDRGGPYCAIESGTAFDGLSNEERRYAHHMARAAWQGTRILLRQTSPEAEGIFDLILTLNKEVKGNWRNLLGTLNFTEEDLDMLLEYFAMFLANIGNYRSQGDTKFVPRVSRTAFDGIVQDYPSVQELWKNIGDAMYAEEPSRFGYPSEQTQSGYYPGNSLITEDEIAFVQSRMQNQGLLSENTRIRKSVISGDGRERTVFDLLVASSLPEHDFDPKELYSDDQCVVSVVHGDHSRQLSLIISELQHAIEYVSNDTEREMLTCLIQSLSSGNMKMFKKSQELWVRNKNPSVEISHGFIESYQDPHGVRASWQGLVAIVNRAQSAILSHLVDNASDIISCLPWNTTAVDQVAGSKSPFENPVFVRPEFVSLDVVAFCCSELWSGVNLPNFEDICQSEGFKNLTLGNVMVANPPNEIIPFISDGDLPLVRELREKVSDISIACHELLGHGSGRLFMETSPGVFNFDKNDLPRDPLTQQAIESWYLPGQTWQNMFKSDAGSLEECRADGIALFLSSMPEVLSIFGADEDSAVESDDITYVSWVHFLSGALKGLSTWDPKTKQWGQAHKRGQYAIFRCLLDTSDDFVRLEATEDNILLRVDREKIYSHGAPRLAKFLLHLQVYKSTAQVENMKTFYETYTAVEEPFIGYREIVMKRKPNRIQYVQPNTYEEGGQIVLRQYSANKESLIQSWTERNV